MADLHFVLLVMATLENKGYFPQDNEVEKMIAKFNDEYPEKTQTKNLIIKTFEAIKKITLPVDSIWFRKSNFFRLVVEIARHNATVPDNILDLLIGLEEQILNNKNKENEFGTYYGYMYAGTNNRKARVERANLFNKYIYE